MRDEARRKFFVGAAGVDLMFAGCAKSGNGRAAPPSGGEDDVAPPEDPMREH